MSNPEQKAQEIERALQDRKDADAAMNEKLDKILSGLDGVTQRVDAIEKARADSGVDTLNAMAAQEPRDKAADLAKMQARADSVSGMFGTSAPRPMDGEKPHAYRVRLLQNFQHNSPEFKNIDLKAVTDAATFDAIEHRIYADSVAAAATPLVAEGTLREVQKRDVSGRNISRFYGEPRAWMQQFMMQPQLVERINKE